MKEGGEGGEKRGLGEEEWSDGIKEEYTHKLVD